MTTALRHGAVRRLAALYALNTVLEWVGSIALMVVAYDATNNAIVAALLLLSKQVLPALLVPALVARFERAEPRVALAATAAMQAAALAALALVGYGILLFPLVVVAGAANVLHRSIIRGTLARAVESAELRGANALLNVTMAIAAPAAPVVAALLISAVGAGGALVAAAGAFGVVVLVCAVMAPFPVVSFDDGELEDESQAKDRSARSDRAVVPTTWLLVLAALTTCVSAIDEPSLLAYARDALASGVTGYGAIFAAQAVGATIGSLLFGRLLAWPMLRIYAFATAVAAVGFLGMAVSPTIELACAAGFLVGFGAGMDWVAIVTAVQEAAPRGRETQVVAKIESAGMAGPAFGLAIGAVIAELGTPRLALVAPGVLSILILVCGAVALRIRASRVQVREPIVFSPSITGGSV